MQRRYLEKHLYTDDDGNILPYGELVNVLADEIGDYDVAAQHEEHGIMLCTFEDFIMGIRFFGCGGIDHGGCEESMDEVEQTFRKIDLKENFLFLAQEYDPQQLDNLDNDEISCSRVDTIQRKKGKGKDILGWGMN